MLETADGPHDHAHRASWANLRGPSRYLAACVAATRPKSLTAAVIPFAVGTSLASAEGPLRWTHAVPAFVAFVLMQICLLYTSPSPRDQRGSRMPSSA